MKSSVQAPWESGQAVDNAEAKHFQPDKFVKLTKRRKLVKLTDMAPKKWTNQPQILWNIFTKQACQADKYGSEKKNQ